MASGALGTLDAMLTPRLDVPPCDSAAALSLARDLGMSFPVAQVLVRRGIATLEDARAWLAGADEHPASLFGRPGRGGRGAAAPRRGQDADHGPRRLRRRRRHVHGDPRARAARGRRRRGLVPAVALGGRLRAQPRDGREARRAGDQAAGDDRLRDHRGRRGRAGRVARDWTSWSPTTTSRAPTAALPDAPIVHPAVCGYPCADLCAGGVAHKVAGALLEAAGPRRVDRAGRPRPGGPGDDRRLRAAESARTGAWCARGCTRSAAPRRSGLRALMRVAKVDPSRVDAPRRRLPARAADQRRRPSAPRRRRAGAAAHPRRGRAPRRSPRSWTAPTPTAASSRSASASRPRPRWRNWATSPPYVLWAEGWHPGVIGIVASRIAERHHRPVVMIALREGEDEGTGSGRSIPAFDLLGGLDAASAHLLRHGGHRAAAGCTIARGSLDAFRAAFVAHAAARLRAEDLVPVERVDAVVRGDELGTSLAEELGRLAPFGIGNPSVSLLFPPRAWSTRARCRRASTSGSPSRPAASGPAPSPSTSRTCPTAPPRAACTRRSRWSSTSGRARSSRAWSCASCCPPTRRRPCWSASRAGTAEWEARSSRWRPRPPRARRSVGVSRRGRRRARRGLAGWRRPPSAPACAGARHARRPAGGRTVRDRRSTGLAGTIAALVHTGEPVLAVAADGPARARQLTGRLGGFAVTRGRRSQRDPCSRTGTTTSWPSIRRCIPTKRRCCPGPPAQMAHLAWGEPELRYSRDVLERDHDLRPGLVGAYRALRDGRSRGRRRRASARGRGGTAARRPPRARPGHRR